MKYILQGFRFGLLLQIAIGPISLYIFSLAGTVPVLQTFPAILGVTLADTLFIFLAIAGVSKLLDVPGVQQALHLVGSFVIILFGMQISLEAFGLSLIPSFSLLSVDSVQDSFLKGFLMTAANPLTLVFWGGVMSAKLSTLSYSKEETSLFGIGAALSTGICLTIVAVIGAVSRYYISEAFLTVVNAGVGGILMVMGIKIFLQKPERA